MQPAILYEALDIYCHWLNLWQQNDANRLQIPPHTYTKEQFLGDSHLIAMIPMYDNLWIFSVYDGDDGGPTELYVWEKDAVPHVIMQGFDTYLQVIYDTDKATENYLNIP